MEKQWWLSPLQADQLRAIPNLAVLGWLFDASVVRQLLRDGVPHQLKWQKLELYGPLDAELAGLLASLPSLTDLTVFGCKDVTFLKFDFCPICALSDSPPSQSISAARSR